MKELEIAKLACYKAGDFLLNLKEKKISRAKFAQMLSENGYEITLDGITYWYRGENNQPEDYKNIITMAKVLEVP
ncbi:hypothetical protein NB019_001674, partial [Campylobacter coli]|nr:hypothetical protein [Campylobacter coli]